MHNLFLNKVDEMFIKIMYNKFLFPVPPVIDRSTIKDITVKAGMNIKLDVRITGEPPPKKIWYHKKTKVEAKDATSIEEEDYRTKLTISPAAR